MSREEWRLIHGDRRHGTTAWNNGMVVDMYENLFGIGVPIIPWTTGFEQGILLASKLVETWPGDQWWCYCVTPRDT